MHYRTLCSAWLLTCTVVSAVACAADLDRAEVRQALLRAARFFGEQVAVDGGYVWHVSLDFQERWGESKAAPRQNWVQPPGTPSVGQAFLQAFELTGETYCLEAARRAAHSLAWGQLSSGGWHYSINFDPQAAQGFHYRRDLEAGTTEAGKKQRTSTFDDDTSQSALCFLMEFDRATNFADETVHRAARFALDAFLKVQRPNGGWPQRFDGPCDPAAWPARPARIPESWSRTFPNVAYGSYYTMNDDVAHDLIRTLLLAHDIYGSKEALASAYRTGDFFIAAQLPEPQPSWGQQYNANMEPAWARRFEPPSVVTRESVSVVRSLGELYVRTGDEKYRRPIAPFLAWLERSRLEDGRFARFYELGTNRPLYFNLKYELVYTDDDMPTHYAFKINVDVPALRRWYDQLPGRRAAQVDQASSARTRWSSYSQARLPNVEQVREVLRDLDAQGRWLDKDGRIASQTFIRNMDVLSAWLAVEAQK